MNVALSGTRNKFTSFCSSARLTEIYHGANFNKLCRNGCSREKVDVCIAHGPFDKPPKFEIRTFSTMTSDLEDLKTWLNKYEVTAIGMESTGVYWKPIFNVMEGDFEIVLANAQRLKAIPRKKMT